MKSRSCKNKGQRASKEVRKILLQHFPSLLEDDIIVTPSGVNGVDLRLSPKAQHVIPFDFEIKNQERLSIWASLAQAQSNASKGNTPVVVFRKNHEKLHICLTFEKFIDLLKGDK